MSEHRLQRLGSNSELDDPGRDPKGLNPPRNLFGGGTDQDSGQGHRTAPATSGPATSRRPRPTSRRPGPTRARRAGRRQPASHSAQSDAGRRRATAGPVSTVVPSSNCHRQPAAGDVDGDRPVGPAPAVTSAA